MAPRVLFDAAVEKPTGRPALGFGLLVGAASADKVPPPGIWFAFLSKRISIEGRSKCRF